MVLNLHGNKYEILIERKPIKNLYLRVKKDNVIYISCNSLMSNKKIKKFIEDNIDEIEKMIIKQEKKEEYENHFYYLGKFYDIVKINDKNKVYVGEQKLFISEDVDIDKWIAKETKRIFKERLDNLYPLFNEIKYPMLTIRKMKTRWGVCNRKLHRITLNSDLIRKDISLIDYVIVHELCHFYQNNHSKNFWDLVENYIPDYKQKRKRLKEN